MTNQTRSLWIIIAVLIIINLLSLGSIWISRDHGSRPNQNPRAWKMDHNQESNNRQRHFIPRRLGFSQEQSAKFDALATQHRQDLSTIMDEIKSYREQLMARLDSGDVNSADSLIHQIGEKQKELEKINFVHFQRVMSLCNEDQKEHFRKIMHRYFQVKDNIRRRMLRERRRQH